MTRYPTSRNEEIELTERERRFIMYVISKAVKELKECKFRVEYHDSEKYKEDYKGMPDQRERSIGYSYAQRNAARDIAGSSLSEVFGGMGIDTINALEALAEREDIHTFCPIIVDEYYGELLKQWGK